MTSSIMHFGVLFLRLLDIFFHFPICFCFLSETQQALFLFVNSTIIENCTFCLDCRKTISKVFRIDKHVTDCPNNVPEF